MLGYLIAITADYLVSDTDAWLNKIIAEYLKPRDTFFCVPT